MLLETPPEQALDVLNGNFVVRDLPSSGHQAHGGYRHGGRLAAQARCEPFDECLGVHHAVTTEWVQELSAEQGFGGGDVQESVGTFFAPPTARMITCAKEAIMFKGELGVKRSGAGCSSTSHLNTTGDMSNRCSLCTTPTDGTPVLSAPLLRQVLRCQVVRSGARSIHVHVPGHVHKSGLRSSPRPPLGGILFTS